MTFLPEKVTFYALFLRMKKARKPDKINVFGLAGDSETRTHDPLNAIQVLSQLSYTPKRCRYLITYLTNMQVDFCITAKKTASPCGEAAQSLSVINIPEGQEFCRPSSHNPESKAHTMFFRLLCFCLRCQLLLPMCRSDRR